jgi:hypothetical protein
MTAIKCCVGRVSLSRQECVLEQAQRELKSTLKRNLHALVISIQPSPIGQSNEAALAHSVDKAVKANG